MKTVQECLEHLGVTAQDLTSCADLREEFVCIKKLYREKVLTMHPDKGGDPAAFRTVQASFEVLREMFSKKSFDSFVTASSNAAETHGQSWSDFEEGMPKKSWEFYDEAAESDVPSYHMELAKSGRSACAATGQAKKCSGEPPLIDEGTIRIGSISRDFGSYSRWRHLECWRVPAKVWLGLPNPDQGDDKEKIAKALRSMNHVILSGFEDLPEDDQESVIEHVMYKGNWARLINRQDKEKAAEDTVSTQLAKSDAVVPVSNAQRHPFIIPVPGVDGARPNSLARKTFVLTGIFPEVDGGTGLRLGQDRVRSMIEAFGGRVTTAISGKTDVLVVGKEPGFSKVSRSRFRKIQLVNLKDLKEKGIVDGGLEDAEKAVVGRRRKGLSLEPDKNVAITAGESPPQLTEEIAVTKRKQLSRKAKDANSPAKRAKEALLRPEPAE